MTDNEEANRIHRRLQEMDAVQLLNTLDDRLGVRAASQALAEYDAGKLGSAEEVEQRVRELGKAGPGNGDAEAGSRSG